MIALVMPIVIKILGMLLDKYVYNKEAKEQFIKMVASLEAGGLKSVSLHNSYREQIEKHRQEIGDAKSKTEII